MYAEFLALLIIWAIVLTIFGVYYWRRRQYGAAVVLTYVILFIGAHALQGAVYAMPWYTPLYEPSVVYAGFVQSTIGLISLAVGAMVVAPFLRQANRKAQTPSTDAAPPPTDDYAPRSSLPVFYLLTGLVAYFVLTPAFVTVPTLSASVTGLYRLIHIGLVLAFWQVFNRPKRNYIALFALTGLTLLWPMITILNDGFLGFGLWPTVFVFTFVMLRQRRRWLPIVLVPIAFYVGLSLISTYFGERAVIRGAVWGGSAFETRINTLVDVLTEDTQFFNINDTQQLYYIDVRLGLNRLVGLGIQRLKSGVNQYAGGQTIADAAMMLIPRAIWPEKPIVVGGQAYVNKYTGVYAGRNNTAVALGQTLEFYINFGTLGVIVGFLLLGIVLAVFETMASRALRRNDYFGFAFWLVPAFGLWLAEDNLIAVVSATVSGMITIAVFNILPRVLFSSRWRQKSTASLPVLEQSDQPV